LPSKRKRRKREDALSEDGWFDLTADLWREPGETPLKLRLVSDTNFPAPLVELLEKRKFDIRTAQSFGWERLGDEELLQKVADRGCVLITLDQDFWSDEKFPLHQSAGVIFVDEKDESIGETDGFELLMALVRSFGGGWSRMKIRASSARVYMKGISWETKKFVYEIRAIRGGIYARGLEGVGV
jgi:Domain of unknown function (DUF5615)